MLVNDIKTSLRITHNKLDDEIEQHIQACLADMKRVGVAVPCPPFFEFSDNNPLIFAAIQLYCKAQYNFLGKGEEFKKGYESLRDVLSMSSGYKADEKKPKESGEDV